MRFISLPGGLKLEACLPHTINHHLFIEHRRRPHPQAVLAIQGAVQRHRA